jgi:hypothetical protein
MIREKGERCSPFFLGERSIAAEEGYRWNPALVYDSTFVLFNTP